MIYKYVNKKDITITIGSIVINAFGGYSSHTTVPELDALSDGHGLDRYVDNVLSNTYNDERNTNTVTYSDEVHYYANPLIGSDTSSGINSTAAVKSIVAVLNLAITSSTLNNKQIIVHLADGDYTSDLAFYGRISGQNIKVIGNIASPESVLLPNINIFGSGSIEFAGVRVQKLLIDGSIVSSITSCYIDNEGERDSLYAPNGIYTQINGTDSDISASSIQADGKIVLSGYTVIGGVYQVLSIRLNTNGTLDTSYATAGVYTQVVGTNSGITASSIQADGKIVLSGAAEIGGVYQVLSIRLNTNGTLDTSYATAGVYTQIIGTASGIYDSNIQADGKIVLSGYAEIGGVYQVLSIRLNTNGTLDTSYATAGVYTQVVGTNSGIPASNIQADGKIVLSGHAEIGGVHQVLSIRLNTNGTLDTSYATAGVYTQIIGTASDIYASSIQADGKIVLSGYAEIGGVYQVLSIRLNTNGTLDTSYATAGIYTQVVGTNSGISASSIQADGKIILSGDAEIGGVYQVLSIRLNTNGTLDTSYATAGVYTQIIGTASGIYDSNIQADGKIVLSGYAEIGGVYQVLSIRLNTNGTLDTSYAPNDVYTQVVGTESSIYTSSIQADGKVVLSGYTKIDAVPQVLSIRLNTNGTLDTSYATAGIYTQVFGTGSNINASSIQADGKIVLSGHAIIDDVYHVLSIRLNTDGTLDTSYATAGIYTQVVGTNSGISASSIQADGKIILSGDAELGSGYQVLSIRLNTDGTLDTSYAMAGIYTQTVGIRSGIYASSIQTDGKIVLSGYAEIDLVSQVLSIRLNTNGTLDTSYATAGTYTQVVGDDSSISASSIQTDGKLILSGYALIDEVYQILSIRLNTNGTLDTSYATAGIYTQVVGTSSGIYASSIQADGKVILSGDTEIDSVHQVLVIRLNTDGTLDTSYATAGTYIQVVGPDSGISASSIQADGKVVLSGYAEIDSAYQVLSIRLNTASYALTCTGGNTLITNTKFSGDGYNCFTLSDTTTKINSSTIVGAPVLLGGVIDAVRSDITLLSNLSGSVTTSDKGTLNNFTVLTKSALTIPGTAINALTGSIIV